MTAVRVTCCIPHCRRKVSVPDGTTREGICDQHWVMAPQKMRDAYARCEGDQSEIYGHWARIRRHIAQKVTRPA